MNRRDQRGMSESVQWTLLAPTVILTIVAIVQVAIWLHARQAVQHAAAAAAEAEAVHQPTRGAGWGAADRITRIAGVREVSVHITRHGDRVEVTVRGRFDVFVPLIDPYISEHATTSRERALP